MAECDKLVIPPDKFTIGTKIPDVIEDILQNDRNVALYASTVVSRTD